MELSGLGQYRNAVASGRRHADPTLPRYGTDPIRKLLEALADQVRHLDEECPCVAAETGNELRRKRVAAVVVQIVVVTGVERCPGAGRPAKQRLRSQAGVQGVVVENEPRKGGVGELMSTAQGQDIDLVCDA